MCFDSRSRRICKDVDVVRAATRSGKSYPQVLGIVAVAGDGEKGYGMLLLLQCMLPVRQTYLVRVRMTNLSGILLVAPPGVKRTHSPPRKSRRPRDHRSDLSTRVKDSAARFVIMSYAYAWFVHTHNVYVIKEDQARMCKV